MRMLPRTPLKTALLIGAAVLGGIVGVAEVYACIDTLSYRQGFWLDLTALCLEFIAITLIAACIIGLKGLLSVVELDEEGMRLVCLGRVRKQLRWEDIVAVGMGTADENRGPSHRLFLSSSPLDASEKAHLEDAGEGIFMFARLTPELIAMLREHSPLPLPGSSELELVGRPAWK